MTDEQFLTGLLQDILTHPFTITASEDDRGFLLRVKADKQDMGTIIGKNGKHIEAIRLVVKLRAKERRVSILVEEPQ